MVSKKTDSSPDSGPQVVITRWPSRPCFAANHAMHHAHVVIWRRMKGGDRYLTPLQHFFNQSIVKHVQAKISWLIHTTDPWTDWYSHLHLVMSVSISIRQVRSWNGTWKRGSSLEKEGECDHKPSLMLPFSTQVDMSDSSNEIFSSIIILWSEWRRRWMK